MVQSNSSGGNKLDFFEAAKEGNLAKLRDLLPKVKVNEVDKVNN